MINGTSHGIINSRQHLAVLDPAAVCWASVNLSVTDVHLHLRLCADSSSPEISVHLSALYFFLDLPSCSLFFSSVATRPFPGSTLFARSVMVRVPTSACPWGSIPHLPSLNLSWSYFYIASFPLLSLARLFTHNGSELTIFPFLLPLLFPPHLFFFFCCCCSRQAALQVSTVIRPLFPSCHSCIMSARLDGHCIFCCNCTTAAHVFYRKTCS